MFYSASMDVKGLANLKDKMRRIVSFSLPILKARFLKRKIPLFVGWELTNRCNLKCRYCGVAHAVRGGELDTQRILLMVDGLKLLGTRFISFTGGEPLLQQKELAALMRRLKPEGNKSAEFFFEVETNGTLLPAKEF